MNEPGTLYEAFIEQLRDTYDAESQVLKALPKMVKAASSPKLQAAFEAHLRETKGHVERLERIFGSLEEEVGGKHCSGMAGILKESAAAVSNGFDERTIDERLYSAGMPDPDLLIRTAGEMRISNFLLWQISYAELWVTEKCWPEFEIADLHQALRDFAARDRRFGGIKS